MKDKHSFCPPPPAPAAVADDPAAFAPMQTITIRFPEFEQLPPERREEVLRRCMDSPEMRQLRARWGRYSAFGGAAVGCAIAIIAYLILHRSTTTTFIAAAIGVVISHAVAMVLKPLVEFRLLRRLLRRELLEHPASG